MEGRQVTQEARVYHLNEKAELLQDIFVTLRKGRWGQIHNIAFICQELGAVEKAFELTTPAAHKPYKSMLKGSYDAFMSLVQAGEITEPVLFSTSVYIGGRTDLPKNHEWIQEIGKIAYPETLVDIIAEARHYAGIENLGEPLDIKLLEKELGRPEIQLTKYIETYKRLAALGRTTNPKNPSSQTF